MSLQIYNDIKGIVQDIIGAYNPSDIINGTIISLSPIQVEIDGRSEYIPSRMFIVPESMVGKTVKASFSDETGVHEGTLTIEPALHVGDKVIILKCQQGQKYLIMDKVSE